MKIKSETFLGQLIIALARSSPAFSPTADADMGVGLRSALLRSSDAFGSSSRLPQDSGGRSGGGSDGASGGTGRPEASRSELPNPSDSDGPDFLGLAPPGVDDLQGNTRVTGESPPRRWFGTDGVRGEIDGSLTADLCRKVAQSVFQVLRTSGGSSDRNTVVVGRDPRDGSPQLESWVIDSLVQSGADVFNVGIVPTAAIARFVQAQNAVAGIAISAGDDPMPRNGLKIFGPDGSKPDDETEARIEDLVDHPGKLDGSAEAGHVVRVDDASNAYVQDLLTAAPILGLKGLRVVVDCANGAASGVADRCYSGAGADVALINANPNGRNINQDWHPSKLDALRAAVVENKADVGIAHDGGADRCLAVDASGHIVDGDQIMAILALAMHDRNELNFDTIVVSEMSNLGLQIAMKQAGIQVITTPVGDRYVSQALRRGNYSLGGEQSGHIIIPRLGPVGDGILTALKLLERVNELGCPLSDLATVVQPIPQFNEDVRVADRGVISESAVIRRALAEAKNSIGDDGRVVMRASGTENVVRIMAQARTTEAALTTARHLARIVGRADLRYR